MQESDLSFILRLSRFSDLSRGICALALPRQKVCQLEMAVSTIWLNQRFSGADIAVSGHPGELHHCFKKIWVAFGAESELRKGFLVSSLPEKEITKLPPRLGKQRGESNGLFKSSDGRRLIA